MTPAQPMRLRAGSAADFPRLAEIELAAAGLFPSGRIPDEPDTLTTPSLAQGVADGLLWVAQQQDQAVGFTLSSQLEGYLHLLELSVHPDWGRQGIGRQLVAQVLERARGLGLPGVTLTTFRDLPFNGPFYASMGFVEIPLDQLSPSIADILAAEEAAGMVQRIGMLCPI